MSLLFWKKYYKEHDPAGCPICMDGSVWGFEASEDEAEPISVSHSMFGEDAPNAWSTTPDSVEWFERHQASGISITLKDRRAMEEVKRSDRKKKEHGYQA